MKNFITLSALFLLASCSITVPSVDLSNLKPSTYDTDISAFSKSMGMKCFAEISGTTAQKQNFCGCVEKTVKKNMATKLTLAQVKETISGAAQGQNPIPNNKIVFSSVKESCAAAAQ